MPQSRRYKKKKSAGKAILAWIIVLAILAAAVFVFVSVFYEDTKKKLDEMNYPRTYSTYVEKAAKDYDHVRSSTIIFELFLRQPRIGGWQQ